MIEKQRKSTTKNEKLRSKFQQYIKDQYNYSLSLNTDIARYGEKLEEAVKMRGDIEEQILADERNESIRQKDTTQVMMAVDNLYNRCRRVLNSVIKHSTDKMSTKEKEGMETEEVKKLETCQKLDVIAAYIQDFQSIFSNEGSSGQAGQTARTAKASKQKNKDEDKKSGS